MRFFNGDWLTGDSFLKRTFAVWGYNLLANLIWSWAFFAAFCIYYGLKGAP